MRSLWGSAQEHAGAVGAWLFAIAMAVITGLTMYWGHVERESRQAWIEGAYDIRLTRNNELLAEVSTLLDRIDARDDSTEEALRSARTMLNDVREEMRQNRISNLEMIKRVDAILARLDRQRAQAN